MRYRVFEDYLGRQWEVWQTNPSASDRRSKERRALADRRRERRADPPERRGEADRRTHGWARFPGIPQLEGGWLCFEREGERKRLAPVPEAWENADDLVLAHLCNFASEEIRGW
jgi:hypothetical protein